MLSYFLCPFDGTPGHKFKKKKEATGKCNVRIIYLNTHEVVVHNDIGRNF